MHGEGSGERHSFEKEYYEFDSFWGDGMLQDEDNMRRILTTIEMVPRDVSSLADVGCGNGIFVNKLTELRADISRVVAVDRSSTALRYVRTEKKEADIAALPFDDGAFDCVSCLQVVEHLPVQVYLDALRELARVARKYLIVSVPYREDLEHGHTQCPQCRSLFNLDLHLRSFDDNMMDGLLLPFGFTCVGTRKEGLSAKYVGHQTFRKIFYREQVHAWASPICPICGYTSERPPESSGSEPAPLPAKRRKIVSYLSPLPKLIWPKEKKHYWIIGLYQKTSF